MNRSPTTARNMRMLRVIQLAEILKFNGRFFFGRKSKNGPVLI
jgi:hypothetical protein